MSVSEHPRGRDLWTFCWVGGRCFANVHECEASSGCESEFVMPSTDSQVVTKPGASVEWFAALHPAGVHSLFGATFPVQLVDLG